MAISTIRFASYTHLSDADAEKTPEADLKSGPTTLHFIFVDNTANAAEDEYLKIWDATSPNEETDEPDFVIFIPQGVTVAIPLPVGNGYTIATGLSYIGTVTQANTTAQVSPTASMKVWFLTAA